MQQWARRARAVVTTPEWMMTGTPGDGSRFCTNDAVLADQVQRFYRASVTNGPPQ